MRYPENIDQLGKNIQRLRKSRGMTQQQLADEANMERRVLQRLEYGEGGPTMDTVISIYVALGATIEELFEKVFPTQETKITR